MIKVENLFKHFETPCGRHDIIENLSFSASDGDFVGLVGKSGSGKSTFLSILAGLQRADKGTIVFDEIPLHNLTDPKLILADEPTYSLDFENTLSIIKIFRALADSGKTIILASHDTDVLSLCDRNIRVE